MECAGMRESTSLNQAKGSTPHRLQDATKLRSTPAVLMRKRHGVLRISLESVVR
jgi:hypothetical protein